MTRTIQVCLGDARRLIGTLCYNRDGAPESAAFEYDAAFLRAADRFAMQPGLPLVAGPQFHRKTRTARSFSAPLPTRSRTAGLAA